MVDARGAHAGSRAAGHGTLLGGGTPDGLVGGRLPWEEDGLLLGVAGYARLALHPGEVAAGVDHDGEVALGRPDANGDHVLEAAKREAEACTSGGCAARSGEVQAVDGVDSGLVPAEKGGVVEGALMATGRRARPVDNLKCSRRNWIGRRRRGRAVGAGQQ
uniref:Uncharacterized protein n=1 Tax=Arundo donax TaxID=35708 RepID=A0A0A9GY93_ARUDO